MSVKLSPQPVDNFLVQSGRYLITHIPTGHISEVYISVYETTYQVDGDYLDKSFFHHYYTVREAILSDYDGTPGDSPGGEEME